MLAKLGTFALVGIEALPVGVEVDNADGQVKTILVGLPEMAVKESTHRIERALFKPATRRLQRSQQIEVALL